MKNRSDGFLERKNNKNPLKLVGQFDVDVKKSAYDYDGAICITSYSFGVFCELF